MGYVGRFAPSPSGPLHLGSLVAALGSYLDARAHRGRWLLRIEDLDRARLQPGCAAQIERTLEDLGLTWDGCVEYQSRRAGLYEEALQLLRERARTYGCDCPRSALAETEDRAYPGTCRTRAAVASPAALRFRVNEAETVSFTDRFQGACSFAMRTLGDVVVRRRDGVVAYQLAVVVDDAQQGVTDVVRGADLLPSTPWQILLQRALDLPAPRYAHLPLVVEPSGAKLAKSRRSLPVDAGRASCRLIEALQLLRHAPPAELAYEKPEAVLAWALKHWNPANLERVQKTTAPVLPP
ncbi:MAG TPA: tRNA glutamyl-Q(34) synthetase GluQRS [Steroidobacteraceae bacterium]|jgi:glutamyl-Q tRNA(Asp) synthetase|nr:tRNA glutamyl-Q(34) synthetase GluQRS [Steroidobacteraceae bacterium]